MLWHSRRHPPLLLSVRYLTKTLLKLVQSASGLNWDELGMMPLYLCDLVAMVLRDATVLGAI